MLSTPAFPFLLYSSKLLYTANFQTYVLKKQDTIKAVQWHLGASSYHFSLGLESQWFYFFLTKVKKAHISRSSDSMIKGRGEKKKVLDSKSEDQGFQSVWCSLTCLSFNLHFYNNRELGLPWCFTL